MSKKLTAAGTLLITLTVCFAYGYFVHRNHIFPYRMILRAYLHLRSSPPIRPGVWAAFQDPGDGENQVRYQGPAASEALTLPYLQGYREGDGARGVTLHDPTAQPGLNFYVSGHAAQAMLVDMAGRPLHEWRYDFDRLGPQFQVRPDDEGFSFRNFWVTARLLEGGDMLAVFSDLALIKLDRDSKLAWARPGRFHHSVTVDRDGAVLALSRRRRIIPRINTEAAVLEDFVTVLNRDGFIQREVSLLDCFERSPYASLLNQVDRWGDLLHTNHLEVIDESLAAKGAPFRPGHWLISVPRLNTVVIVDPTASRVVWALSGMWSSQHHPRLLPNGNLLVFDNLGNAGRSRVIEVEPLTQQVVWEYPGGAKADVFSACCGGVERLANGNTLVVESTNGRAFEVTPDKRLVWEFVNPARHGQDQRLVATLFSLERIEPGLDWLRPPAPPVSVPPASARSDVSTTAPGTAGEGHF